MYTRLCLRVCPPCPQQLMGIMNYDSRFGTSHRLVVPPPTATSGRVATHPCCERRRLFADTFKTKWRAGIIPLSEQGIKLIYVYIYIYHYIYI